MGRSRAGLVFAVVAALALALTSLSARAGSTTQELTITASDGTRLACGLVLPGGSPPAGGWPGVLLFHGFGDTHSAMETLATGALAPAGFVSLACDARGTGASGGRFGLAGPADVQDVRDLFAWLAARPDVSDTQIGAYGEQSGGGVVLDAAAAGVPFKAIAPAGAWTNLERALAPGGVAKVGSVENLAKLVPGPWDPALAQARDDLTRGAVTAAVKSAAAARSSRSRLHSLDVPALLLQDRHDLLFDLDQALAAYRLLVGPKRLYAGGLGHATTTVPGYFAEVVAWFRAYLAGGPKVGGGVELAHDPPDGTTTVFKALPSLRSASVNLPGTTTLSGAGSLRRSVRLTGGPLETFGDGSISVRYSGASGAWTQLVATVSVKGRGTPVTEGAARIAKPAGVLRIPLLNEAVLLPRGKRLVVTVGTSSPDGLYQSPPPVAGRNSITIGRVTLKLSLLRLAVSR